MTSKREYHERYLDQKYNAQWWYDRWRAQCNENAQLDEINQALATTVRLQADDIRSLTERLCSLDSAAPQHDN